MFYISAVIFFVFIVVILFAQAKAGIAITGSGIPKSYYAGLIATCVCAVSLSLVLGKNYPNFWESPAFNYIETITLPIYLDIALYYLAYILLALGVVALSFVSVGIIRPTLSFSKNRKLVVLYWGGMALVMLLLAAAAFSVTLGNASLDIFRQSFPGV